jgi:hypothetical protein
VTLAKPYPAGPVTNPLEEDANPSSSPTVNEKDKHELESIPFVDIDRVVLSPKHKEKADQIRVGEVAVRSSLKYPSTWRIKVIVQAVNESLRAIPEPSSGCQLSFSVTHQ